MSGRSFRDRYAALAEAETTDLRPTHLPPDDWPLPHGARLIDTLDGPCSVHDQVYGGDTISTAFTVFESCFIRDQHSRPHPRDMLFLDTETTGLSGGTGTHVFLVGVGRFSGTSLLVRQFFMRHPGDERAVLTAVTRELTEAGAVVTYNGRAFDMPLLETRFRLHGRAFQMPPAHVDLLSTTRAIWKHRLPSCALSDIERAVLGIERGDDAPGWLIPQLYFSYLRTRQLTVLEPIFNHNRADIVALARLAALVAAFEAGLDEPTHDIDRLALALHRLRAAASQDAVDAVARLWPVATIPADLRLKALRALSGTLKRQGMLAQAAREWQRGLHDPSRAVRHFAAEELAKYLEHRERKHAEALEITRRAADGAALARDDAALASFQRRLARLERKLQGSTRPTGQRVHST